MDRVAPPARTALVGKALGQPYERVRARSADPVDAARAGPRDHLALTREGRIRHLPTLPDAADALGVGHACPVKEDLVEVNLTTDVAQRPHVDTVLVQVEQEVSDAFALGHVGVRPGEQEAAVGREVRPVVHTFWPVTTQLVAVATRPASTATRGPSPTPVR